MLRRANRFPGRGPQVFQAPRPMPAERGLSQRERLHGDEHGVRCLVNFSERGGSHPKEINSPPIKATRVLMVGWRAVVFVAVNPFKILGRTHSWNPMIIYWGFNSWQVPRLLWVGFIMA